MDMYSLGVLNIHFNTILDVSFKLRTGSWT